MNRTLLLEEITEIWKHFCDLHNKLYESTCQEYTFLLESRTEALLRHIQEKVALINQIKDLELKRQGFIKKLNASFEEQEIKNAADLLTYFDSDALEKYNNLLASTIKKIEEQNKKNRTFINKATHNLRSIKQDIKGQKSSTTYDEKGKQQNQFF